MVIWSICAGDYYPYYPENTPRLITGAMTHLGISLAMTFVQILGVGLATGAAKKDTWGSAFEKGQGQLMVEAFAPLGGFGKFCGVVLALGPSKSYLWMLQRIERPLASFLMGYS